MLVGDSMLLRLTNCVTASSEVTTDWSQLYPMVKNTGWTPERSVVLISGGAAQSVELTLNKDNSKVFAAAREQTYFPNHGGVKDPREKTGWCWWNSMGGWDEGPGSTAAAGSQWSSAAIRRRHIYRRFLQHAHEPPQEHKPHICVVNRQLTPAPSVAPVCYLFINRSICFCPYDGPTCASYTVTRSLFECVTMHLYAVPLCGRDKPSNLLKCARTH